VVTFTAEQLCDACRTIYDPCEFKHAPAQIFLDSFPGEPPTTFLRASFPEKFTAAAAAKLHALGKLIQSRHEVENIVFVCYFYELNPQDLARHSIAISDR